MIKWSPQIEEQALAIFTDLLKLDSSNPPHNEEGCAKYIQQTLSKWGITSEIIEYKRQRSNLIAKLEGGKEKPLYLISHLDVAPAEKEQWDFPPFEATIQDGIIHGRGTLDTKQLTAMQLLVFMYLKQFQNELNRDIYLIASADEEAGSVWGMEKLVENQLFPLTDGIVINEGGGFYLEVKGCPFLLITVGEKAQLTLKLTYKGTGGHGSCPPEDNPLVLLATNLELILTKEFKTKTSSVVEKYQSLLKNKHSKLSHTLLTYMQKTGVVIDKLACGTAENVIDSSVNVQISLRYPPNLTKEEVLKSLAQILDQPYLEYEILNFQPGFESSLNNPLYQLLSSKTKAINPDFDLLPILALGRTDGRFFGPDGLDVFGFSPTDSSTPMEKVLQFVHQKNECISVNSFLTGTRIIFESLFEFCLKGSVN